MNKHRSEMLEWIAQGRVRTEMRGKALCIAGVTPGKQDWRLFLDTLALWLGTIFCAVAVIFFFAYNWKSMGRFAKFGLAEALIVAGLVMSWRLGLERISGKATLLLLTLLIGALLALVGQTYQTGADTYELFAVWAIAVLPWVVVGRFAALWLVWIVLVNMAAMLYFQIFRGMLTPFFNSEEQQWSLFIINTVALVIWEAAAYRGVQWLRERWAVRILATVSGYTVTMLMLDVIFDHRYGGDPYAVVAYFAWMGAGYFYYRMQQVDVYMLAGGVLSAIVVGTSFLAKNILKFDNAAGFLLIGLLVIGMSALGGMWLKSVAAKERI
jgi:uncharacterized membrane protein